MNRMTKSAALVCFSAAGLLAGCAKNKPTTMQANSGDASIPYNTAKPEVRRHVSSEQAHIGAMKLPTTRSTTWMLAVDEGGKAPRRLWDQVDATLPSGAIPAGAVYFHGADNPTQSARSEYLSAVYQFGYFLYDIVIFPYSFYKSPPSRTVDYNSPGGLGAAEYSPNAK